MTQSEQRRRSPKLIIRNLPAAYDNDKVKNLVKAHGKVVACFNNTKSEEPIWYVTFENPDEASDALNELNQTILFGQTVKADFYARRRNNSPGAMNNYPRFSSDLPLRMRVPSDMVGAIIGRKGEKIKEITDKTRARVDVHRHESPGVTEKTVTIYGPRENCSNACQEILNVLKAEGSEALTNDMPLKLLAHNTLCGRLIGKGGAMIKKIMEETDTRITVSRVSDYEVYLADRVISIRGSFDNISAAEKAISANIAKSYASDLQSYKGNSYMNGYGPMPNAGMHPPPPRGYYPDRPGMHQYGAGPMIPPMPSYGLQGGGPGSYGMGGPGAGILRPVNPYSAAGGNGNQQQIIEHAVLLVPDNSVGAIIGARGVNIRNISTQSGAQIKITGKNEMIEGAEIQSPRTASPVEENEPQPIEGSNSEKDVKKSGYYRKAPTYAEMRRVKITGTPEAQWKAQFYIYDKIRHDPYFKSRTNNDVALTCEIMVPKTMVGRIIGKGGQNVRDLQHYTSTIVRLPEDNNADQEEEVDEVRVEIIGNFYQSQNAQRHLRAIVEHARMNAVANGTGSGAGPSANAMNSGPPVAGHPGAMSHSGQFMGSGQYGASVGRKDQQPQNYRGGPPGHTRVPMPQQGPPQNPHHPMQFNIASGDSVPVSLPMHMMVSQGHGPGVGQGGLPNGLTPHGSGDHTRPSPPSAAMMQHLHSPNNMEMQHQHNVMLNGQF